jgi:hypothetical protein
MLNKTSKRKKVSQSDSIGSIVIRIYFVMFYRRSIGEFSKIVHILINVINFFHKFLSRFNIAQVHYTLVYQSNKL